VREDALDLVYLLSQAGRGRVSVVRERPAGDAEEIYRSGGGLRSDRLAVALAILGDALDERPSRKLARDYSRFLPTRRDGAVRISAQEVQAWLETWQPPLADLFRRLR
jgi:hypothetical protein